MKNKIAAIVVGCMVLSGVARADLLMQDSFTYANGQTTNVSGSAWFRISGTANDSLVNDGQLENFAARSDDVSRSLGVSNATGSIYYSLTLQVTNLPSAAGTYIASIQQSSTLFRDRLYIRTTGATAGNFRIGVANGSTFGGDWGSDLLLNTTYTIVVRSNLDTDESVLWVNPINESSFSVTNLVASTVSATQFGFRQASGGGNVLIDSVAVGTTFNNVVVPEPATAMMMVGGLGVLLYARRRRT